jgi:hypothetical protein
LGLRRRLEAQGEEAFLYLPTWKAAPLWYPEDYMCWDHLRQPPDADVSMMDTIKDEWEGPGQRREN